MMKAPHIAPGYSAGHSLRQAISDAGQGDDVLRWPDDLSRGPIDSDDPAVRATWWKPLHGDWDVEGRTRSFWSRVETTGDRLVVWFARHSSQELSFFLAWADRLGERTYDIIDVTGLRIPFKRPDGSEALSSPGQAVALVSRNALRSLLGSERPVTAREQENARQHWLRLKRENAPFRVVDETGLVSASDDHFDRLILERAAPDWKRVVSVIAEAMGYNSEPYIQVGDMMLLTRVVALVNDGKLLADGDPWDMRACRVRLPALAGPAPGC